MAGGGARIGPTGPSAGRPSTSASCSRGWTPNLPTIAARGERAIAGLSQGGFCSLSYAARHPDLFAVALGYSGAPDIYYDPDARLGAMAIINATEVGLTHVPADTFFGDPVSDGINWAAHDPASLAENLRWTQMDMYWGNGQLGPYDTLATELSSSEVEGAVWRDNNDFQARLQSLHIPAAFDDYGPGTHTWPYWSRDLSWSIATIMADFAHPAPPPSHFVYTSAEGQYSLYGWSVTTTRTAREFSTLTVTGPRHFQVAGSGAAVVLTPPVYRPGARYVVTLAGARVAPHRVRLTAGRDRRLRVVVALGPPNPYQEDTPAALVAGTAVYTTTATIAPARRWHRHRHRSSPSGGDDVRAPRLAPATRAQAGWLNAVIVEVIRRGARTRQAPNLFATLARQRRLFKAWLVFAGALMPGGKLPRADTELVILRVAHNRGCEYEWRHHQRLARAAGLSAEQIEAVRAGGTGWSERQALLLAVADELHARGDLSDALWTAASGELTEPELIELVMLVGHYEMLATVINTLRIAPDERAR